MFYGTGYEAIFTGVGSACFAQILKVIFYFCTHKKIDFKIFTTTGGMPSSHSAGVIGLTTSVGLIAGFDSIAFAISLGFALVVIQDAQGLRRAAGKTAATLNRLVSEIFEEQNKTNPYEVLKELLGHTPFEVFMGTILGILCALWTHYFMPTISFLSFLR